MSYEQNPTHIYEDLGTYTVIFTVTGPGGSDTETRIDYITVEEPNPFRGLVYSPVTPCRIVDTRIGGGGVLSPGQRREYFVYGPPGDIATQGGNPAGCPSPSGEPSGVHINVTSDFKSPGFSSQIL